MTAAETLYDRVRAEAFADHDPTVRDDQPTRAEAADDLRRQLREKARQDRFGYDPEAGW